MKKTIENETFGEERALYSLSNTTVRNCRFEGAEDGESALKECRDTEVTKCCMALRYPLWHAKKLLVDDSEFSSTARAALWYCDDVTVKNCILNGIKALRECRNVNLCDTSAISPEFGWKNKNLEITNCSVEGDYAFFESSQAEIHGLKLSGKYSFQYADNFELRNCDLNTKDAFWHSKNVTVYDSVLIGEYLGWYSENLTLVRCKIKGTQPLCYCKKLTLVDCETEDTNLCFEYSDVNADIKGNVVSVKNPLSGTITADSFGEIILTEDAVYKCSAQINSRRQTSLKKFNK